MATIYREFTVPADASEVWKRLADVGSVNTLMDFLGEVTVDGNIRTCELGDQGLLEELIVSVDDDLQRLAYSIRQSPFNFAHHHASTQALANEDGTTTLVWVTDVTPDDVAPAVAEAIDAGVASIERAFGV